MKETLRNEVSIEAGVGVVRGGGGREGCPSTCSSNGVDSGSPGFMTASGGAEGSGVDEEVSVFFF